MTVKQMQTRLKAAGLYPGAIDGIIGAQTLKAIESLLDKSCPEQPRASLSKYFSVAECRCPCCGACDMTQQILNLADTIREHFNAPTIVTSGYRCKQHNAKVGGVSNSRHLSGRAMDIVVTGHTAKEVLQYAESLPQTHYCHAITGNAIHIDTE